ncbi:MAG: F0F1 ATP synthase subunit A [Chloroflexota bacterium]
MNPENNQQEQPTELDQSPNESSRKLNATGPVAQFLQGDTLKSIVDSDLMKSLEGVNQNIANRLNTSPRTVSIIAFTVVMLMLSVVIRTETPHVSLAAEPILAGGWFTNSLLHMLVVDVLVIGLAYMATRQMSFVPSGWQNFMEITFDYLYDLCESVAGHNARRFAPWCMTIFFFIIVSNWSGLIPGVGTIGMYHIGDAHAEDTHTEDAHEESTPAEGEHDEGEDAGEGEGDDHGQKIDDLQMADRQLDNQIAMSDGKIIFASAATVNPSPAAAGDEHKVFVPFLRPPTASLNFTFALAIMTMVLVQYYGVKKLGSSYFGKFFTLRGEGFMKGINGFVGILELISEISRILTFAFRLFGNIFAGEVMLATMAFLVTFMLPIPFYFLEIFVGFVQALVFMMLALIFFTLSEHAHGDEHH